MKKYDVIIKTDLVNLPKEHELSAAHILAYHFKTDVVFLRQEYARTPDVNIDGIRWEIKSPMGNGKRTINNNFNAARKQSKNIVIDLRRIKMHDSKANARIKAYLSRPHHFKRVIVISKSKKVVVIL